MKNVLAISILARCNMVGQNKVWLDLAQNHIQNTSRSRIHTSTMMLFCSFLFSKCVLLPRDIFNNATKFIKDLQLKCGWLSSSNKQ